MVLLVLMVCVGAPIVEELVYRGLLQGSFAARTYARRGLARRRGRGSPSSTSGPSSTPACSCSAWSPAPASW